MKSSEDKEMLNHVPVIIGNFLPFRLILRETDTWKPTLEQINNRDYDYVKLCRLSSFIDVGIAPFSLGITFDGSLVLPATKQFVNRSLALDKFNETLAFLLLGGIYCEAVQPTDISYGSLFFDGYLRIQGGGTGAQSNFHRSIQTKHVGTLDVIELLSPKTLLQNDLEIAYKKGKSIFSKLENLTPSLLLNGSSHYVQHKWIEGLVYLWTSIEQLVNMIWTKEIINKKLSSDEIIEGRNKFLNDYRTWTTSTKVEVLYQKNYINSDVYRIINCARKARNDFIHNGEEVTEDKVRCALEATFKLISLIISDYKNDAEIYDTLEIIYKHQRGDLYPSKSVYGIDEVSHWLSLPPLPGDNNWGNREYEIIKELVLQPINNDK